MCCEREQKVEHEVTRELKGSIMSAGERYRQYAVKCVRLAQQTKNSADKALLLQMAETWRRLAERAEGQEPDSDG